MKTSTMRWMIAVAALAVAAGSASAQTFKAQIPMPFHVNDSRMAPGSYEIRVATGFTGTEIVYVRNLDTNDAVALLSGPKSDAPMEWKKEGAPRLAFACVDSNCSLTRLWNGEAPYAIQFHTPDLRNVQARGATVVTLAMIKVR